jgi:hypothetical protein
MGLKLSGIAVAAVSALTLSSSAAHAEPRGVDWSKAVYDLDQYVRGNTGGTEMLAPARPSRLTTTRASEDMGPRLRDQGWFGVAPRLTLVARDWNGSLRLAGDRLSLTDSMRLSASTRMLVGRARLSSTRFTPFVQLGVGQWRVDRTYLPLTPFMEEVATQVGGGFEIRLAKYWRAAVESSCTSLIRDGQSLERNSMWSTFLASRIEF